MRRLTVPRPLIGHSFHNRTDAELRYIIKDASEAGAACSHDPACVSKYADQVCDAVTILGYRGRLEDAAAQRREVAQMQRQK